MKNPDKEGFWDAVVFQPRDFGQLGDFRTGVLLGDSVRGRFYTQLTVGRGWVLDDDSCVSRADEAAFAASNSSVFVFGPRRYIIVSGGKGSPRALLSPLLSGKPKACVEAALPQLSRSHSAIEARPRSGRRLQETW